MPHEGKGALGQMVENIYFLLETSNNPASDFSEAGIELKCTPLKKSKNDECLIKERLVCSMINYCECGRVWNATMQKKGVYCWLSKRLCYCREGGGDG